MNELEAVKKQLEKVKKALQQYQQKQGTLNSTMNIKENIVVVVKRED